MIKDAPSENKVLDLLWNFLHSEKNGIFVSHSSFDYFFLNEKYRQRNKKLNLRFLDTLVLTRNLFPELKKHNLAFLSQYFNVTLSSHHRAEDDTKATAEILLILLNKIWEENLIGMEFKSIKNVLTRVLIYCKNLNGFYDLLDLLTQAYT